MALISGFSFELFIPKALFRGLLPFLQLPATFTRSAPVHRHFSPALRAGAGAIPQPLLLPNGGDQHFLPGLQRFVRGAAGTSSTSFQAGLKYAGGAAVIPTQWGMGPYRFG